MDKKPGDATQPLSESQVVAVTPKPPIAPNDQSVAWKGKVVGPDEFAPAPRASRGKWIVAGVIAAAGAGIVAYVLWPSSSDKKDEAAAGSGSGSGSGSAMPAAVPPVTPDAPPPPPPVDAATADAPADAATPPAKKSPTPVKKKPPAKKHAH